MIYSKLTVFFQNPFWIGVYERTENGLLEVNKVTFGAEPKDYDLYEYFLKNYTSLKFSPSVRSDIDEQFNINPKRMQRLINKQLGQVGISTKSQQALKLQHEISKAASMKKRKEKKLEQLEENFIQRQQKKKEKHRGH